MAAPFLAFAIAIVLSPLVLVALRRCGIVDMPNERSSHTRPTPRGGGLAPTMGVVVAVLISGSIDDRTRAALLVAVVAFGLIGLVEDVTGIPVVWRLSLQVAAACALLPWLLSDLREPQFVRVGAFVVAVLFVVGYVNAFNFMDGINGISVAQAVVAGGVWYVVGRAEGADSFALAGAVVAAAALGFAPFNFPQARVFLGDAGSYAFGAALAVLAVLAQRAGIAPEAVIAPLALYLADTGAALVRRFLRREPWYRPHRDHTYQQLVRSGWSHTTTTLAVGALILVLAALGAVSLTNGGVGVRMVADITIVLLLAGYLAAPGLVRRLDAKSAVA